MIRWFGGSPTRDRETAPRPLPRSRRFAVRPQNSRYGALEEAGQTLSSLFALPATPVLARLIFFNDLDVPWPLDSVAMALTSTAGDGLDPLGADGAPDPALWRRATFAHGGTNRDPVDLPDRNEQFSLTIASNSREPGQPELFFSDWTPIDGPSRADGRARYCSCAPIPASGCAFRAASGHRSPGSGRPRTDKSSRAMRPRHRSWAPRVATSRCSPVTASNA